MKKYLFIPLLIISIFLIGCDKMIPNNNNPTDTNDTNNTDKPNDTNDTNDNNNDTNNDIKDNPTSDDSKDDETSSIVNTKVRLFLFDTKDYVMYYIDKEIPVEDKAIIKALTTELQTYSPDENILNLTDEVEITSAKLDTETNVLKIVFSSSYTDKMLLGSSTESGLLSSLISTYGYNLKVDKVALYFGDELYTSLRGDLPNGYFDVHYEDAIPYNK